MNTLRDSGLSTSSAPGTKVAEIEAASGKKLVHWYLAASQTNSSNTQLKIIVTYTDDTTTVIDSVDSNAHHYFGNASGVIRRQLGSVNQITSLSAKDVKNIRVETLGTGTGTRYAALSATETDTTDTLRSVGSSTSGTPGTVVATIEADSGKALVGWNAIVAQESASSTQIRLTVTYTDDTTSTTETTSNFSHIILANAGGAVRTTISNIDVFSDKQVKSLTITTLGAGSGSRYGCLSAEQETIGTTTILKSAGSSTSGTPGTVISSIQAQTGNYLYAPTIFVAQNTTLNTTIRTVITYEDDTTSTSDTNSSGSGVYNHGNAGGMVRITANAANQVTNFQTKLIKKIEVQTLGSGTGTRYAAISALESSSLDSENSQIDFESLGHESTNIDLDFEVSGSMVSNPSFEPNLNTWQADSGYWTRTDEESYHGDYSVKLVGAAFDYSSFKTNNANPIQLVDGLNYRLTFWTKGTLTTGGQPYIQINTDDPGYGGTITSQAIPAYADWTKITIDFTASGTDHWLRLYNNGYHESTSLTYYFDLFEISLAPTLNDESTEFDIESRGNNLQDTQFDLEVNAIDTTNTNFNFESRGVDSTNTEFNLESRGVDLDNSEFDVESSGIDSQDTEFDFEVICEAPPFVLKPTTNITDGESTTAQLTAPSGKSGDFSAGKIHDESNPSDSIDIASDYYTELEWSIEATESAILNDTYEFRLSLADESLDTITTTPEWTITPETQQTNTEFDIEVGGIESINSEFDLEARGIDQNNLQFEFEALGSGLSSSQFDIETRGIDNNDTEFDFESNGRLVENTQIEFETNGLDAQNSEFNFESRGIDNQSVDFDFELEAIDKQSTNFDLETRGRSDQSSEINFEVIGFEVDNTQINLETRGLDNQSSQFNLETRGRSDQDTQLDFEANGTDLDYVVAQIDFEVISLENPFVLKPTSNISDGDSTTAQLSAPSGKSGDFNSGKIHDESNPSDSIDIDQDHYTEIEWSIEATETAQLNETYEFRLTITNNPLDTITTTPEWTVVPTVYGQDTEFNLETRGSEVENVDINFESRGIDTSNTQLDIEIRGVSDQNSQISIESRGADQSNSQFDFEAQGLGGQSTSINFEARGDGGNGVNFDFESLGSESQSTSINFEARSSDTSNTQIEIETRGLSDQSTALDFALVGSESVNTQFDFEVRAIDTNSEQVDFETLGGPVGTEFDFEVTGVTWVLGRVFAGINVSGVNATIKVTTIEPKIGVSGISARISEK